MLLAIAFIAVGFLSGSVLYSKIVSGRLADKDICAVSDDKNPGAFNAFKHCGKKIGFLCLFLDLAKGFIPVFTASFFVNCESFAYTLIIVAPVLGHAAGIFNRFRGGKCISVSFGVMLGVTPVTPTGLIILAALYIFFSTAVKIKPNSLRSITVYFIYGAVSCVALAICGMPYTALGCLAVSVVVIAKHLAE